MFIFRGDILKFLGPNSYMEETVKALPQSLQVFMIMAALWFFQQWWSDKRERNKTQDEALNKCTLAIVELQTQIKNLTEVLYIIPKLKEDIDAAHEKIRDGQAKNNI